jgi:hypothetical protein
MNYIIKFLECIRLILYWSLLLSIYVLINLARFLNGKGHLELF